MNSLFWRIFFPRETPCGRVMVATVRPPSTASDSGESDEDLELKTLSLVMHDDLRGHELSKEITSSEVARGSILVPAIGK